MKINSLSSKVYGRLPLLKDELSIIGYIGPAWLFYRNIGKAIDDSVMLTGSSPGFETSLHICYEILPSFHLAIQGNYIRAFLKEFTPEDGTTKQVIKLEEDNFQNILRIDFSFGIFYTFRHK